MPSLVIFGFHLPFLLSFQDGQDVEFSRTILQKFRAPQHYDIETFAFTFLTPLAWHLAGIFSYFSKKTPREEQTRLLVLLASFLVIFIGAFFFYTPTIAQLFFWRLIPFGVLLSQIAVFFVFVG